MPAKNKDSFLTVRVDPHLLKKLQLHARETERTVAGSVRWIVGEYFNNEPSEAK